ncbi:glycosyltransferase family 2 protein [Ectopseudomonas hydrolytica]|uniref:glycosyltransferase family 2 protein n=1 Tax=Ectopseudomonas hydrolytica TaxID=2493633 RepID=UPI00376EDF64
MYNEAIQEASTARERSSVVPSPTIPKVAILLACYNGERFLAEQLQSIIQQSHDNWMIVASDDGSCDGTLALLLRYQQQLGEHRLRVIAGPRRGFVANFMSLISTPFIRAEYFAFCDQDDIWHIDHLSKAIAWMQSADPSVPALHCGRTRLIREDGQPFGVSPLFPRAPSFKNALVQSIAGGNTMVFNHSAKQLLERTASLPVVSHDWWAYLLVSGTGGRVHYSASPSVDYRQHGGNLVGSNSSLKDRLHRIRRMFAGHFQSWNETNIESLHHCREMLSEESLRRLQAFARARRSPLPLRLWRISRSGVYRQTVPGNLGLLLAALLGKL